MLEQFVVVLYLNIASTESKIGQLGGFNNLSSCQNFVDNINIKMQNANTNFNGKNIIFRCQKLD